MTGGISDPRGFLAELFRVAVAAADPETALRPHLPERPKGRTVVIGAGKGAAQLAAAFEALWDGPVEGVVVTRYGYGAPCVPSRCWRRRIPCRTRRALRPRRGCWRRCRGSRPDDLVVALVCGGGSALLPAPPGDLTLEDEIAVNEALLASGAPISAMNVVRKHLSRIKGGRLAAAAAPARVVSLIVSDIPGDDPALVASGPTVPDAAGRDAALAVVERYGLALPPRARAWLDRAEAAAPAPDDPAFARNDVRVVASARISLEAAAAAAEAAGVSAAILSDSIEGEARDAARVIGAMARETATRGRPFRAPVVLLSGGETTVTLRGGGKGGRNSEFALSLGREIAGLGVVGLAADTDGIDGSEDNAGAFVDGTSWARLSDLGRDPAGLLADNDAWSAFDALGDLFVTGPTGTNVNDFRAILIGA
jgi:glycerate 2-kinase